MAFTLPEFNLTCNIWRNPLRFGIDPPDVTSECNLAYGRRTALPNALWPANEDGAVMQLLLPAGTDVRDLKCSNNLDGVEVPAGSGRLYLAIDVDDAGKGFDNEHRIALLVGVSSARTPFAVPAGYMWPAPIP